MCKCTVNRTFNRANPEYGNSRRQSKWIWQFLPEMFITILNCLPPRLQCWAKPSCHWRGSPRSIIMFAIIANIQSWLCHQKLYISSWLQGWRLVSVGWMHCDLRRRNQDQNSGGHSGTDPWGRDVSGSGEDNSLQYWPMPRFTYHNMKRWVFGSVHII